MSATDNRPVTELVKVPTVVSTLLALLQLKAVPSAALLACVRWLVYEAVVFLFLEQLKKKTKTKVVY